jgi:stage II sporulation protein Q
MKEENKGASKNKWSRIFKKKGFFPALYLTLAALLVSAVVWFQAGDDQAAEDEVVEDDRMVERGSDHPDEEAEPVLGADEVIEMPVVNSEEAEIVTKFYDYDADEEEQVDSLILYNNRYYQSTGLGIAHPEGESFDVVASLSGTVSEVKEDPLLGNVVALDHTDDVVTYYASLGEMTVQAGDDVEQGDVIGTAGKNLYGQDNGTHVHFEIRKDGQEVNPEEFFNQPVASLNSVTEDVMEETETNETETQEAEEDPSAQEEESSDLINDLSGIDVPEESETDEDEETDVEEDFVDSEEEMEEEDLVDNEDEVEEE